MAWGSTNKTKLNQLLRHQMHASRIIFFKDKLTHAKPLLQIYKCSKHLPAKYFSYFIIHAQS